MFQSIENIITLKWIRDHPVFTTSLALAGAAYSLALSYADHKAGIDELREKSTHGKAIRWSDENGGKLANVIEESPWSSRLPEKHTTLQPKCLKMLDDNTPAEDRAKRIEETSNTTTGSSPSSPAWGWFVTFTPPQDPMYENRIKN